MGEVQRVVEMANGSAALGASFVAVGFDTPRSVYWKFGGRYANGRVGRRRADQDG